MTDITTITVRYAHGTYVARVKGQKKTSSCVYDAEQAAKSLARKLDLNTQSLEMVRAEAGCVEFKAKPIRRLPMAWKMVPSLSTIAMDEAGKRVLEEGGSVCQIFAAMLSQAPSPETWPEPGSQAVREEDEA